MAGYYVPSNFSANYVAEKKNDDSTYTYDSAVNKVGIDAQRNLQQLNKQYNVTINNAYAQHLFANKGLQASALGSGYKDAYAQHLQESLAQNVEQAGLSAQDTKQLIFNNLGTDLTDIGKAQIQDINNMRRMASSLEQYHEYIKTLNSDKFTSYVDDQQFKVGNEWTFEDNYDKLFSTQKGVIGNYLDENSLPGLSLEDWLRQNSGTSATDTTWLDWVYTSGLSEYQDFIKKGVSRLGSEYVSTAPTPRPDLEQPLATNNPRYNTKYSKFSIGSK